MGAIAAAAVGLVVASTAWWISYSRNQHYLAEIAAELPNVQHLVGDTQSELLPKLTGVRTLAETRGTPDGRVPWSWRFGLYQGPKLEAASQAAYQRMLRDAFLPAMAASLERGPPAGPVLRQFEDLRDAVRSQALQSRNGLALV